MRKLSRILPLTIFCAAAIGWAGPANADTEWEYEPGEGLHEEEWYDPSDWFNDDNDIDYEYDNWGYDYGYDDDYDYDDYDYDYGLYDNDYDNGAYDYDYGIYDGRYDVNNSQNDRNRSGNARNSSATREINGQIVGFQRVRAEDGRPESLRVKVRTDDGRTRILQLGDRAYLSDSQARFTRNERIKIRGRQVNVDGKNLFKAEQIRGQNGDFDLPSYQYDQTIRGRLVGVQKAATRDGELEAVVAKVRTDDGRTMNVLLGSPEDLREAKTVLRPNSRVDVRGWTRDVDGDRTFYIQDVDVRDQNQQQKRNNRNR